MGWFDQPTKDDRVIEAYRHAERRRHQYDWVRMILEIVSVIAAILSAVLIPVAALAGLVRRFFR